MRLSPDGHDEPPERGSAVPLLQTESMVRARTLRRPTVALRAGKLRFPPGAGSFGSFAARLRLCSALARESSSFVDGESLNAVQVATQVPGVLLPAVKLSRGAFPSWVGANGVLGEVAT